MSKVYVVQRPKTRDPVTGVWRDKYNIAAASFHGDLVDMLPEGNWPRDSRKTIEIMEKALAKYSDEDSILALGDPVAISAACLVAARVSGGRVTILKWDKRSQSYQSHVLQV